jgi:PhnB protein
MTTDCGDGTSMADQVPADWQDKVMHRRLTVGEQVLTGGDAAPDRYEEPKGFSLQITSTSEAKRIFPELGRDGKVLCRSRRRSGPSVLAW